MTAYRAKRKLQSRRNCWHNTKRTMTFWGWDAFYQILDDKCSFHYNKRCSRNPRSWWHSRLKPNGNKWLLEQSAVRRGFLYSAPAGGHVLGSERLPHWWGRSCYGFTAPPACKSLMRQAHWVKTLEKVAISFLLMEPVRSAAPFVIHQLLFRWRRQRRNNEDNKHAAEHTVELLIDTQQQHSTRADSQGSCQTHITG